MKIVLFSAALLFLVCGCATKSYDEKKIDKVLKLSEQIELNDYKLVATNGTLFLIKSR